jgi:hypothetical protein
VRYWLPTKPAGDITLTIIDAGGVEIRTFTSKKDQPTPGLDDEAGQVLDLGRERREGESAPSPAEADTTSEEQEPLVPKEAGLNRFVWDMRGPEARKVEGDTSMAVFLSGAHVLPGHYQVRLAVGEQSWTQPFEIVPDPRGHQTADGAKAQYELLVRINEKVSAAHDAVNQIRDVTGQIETWRKRLKGQQNSRAIVDAAEALQRTLRAVEEELFKSEPETDLHYTSTLKLSGRLAALKFAVDVTDYAPTRQAVEVYEELADKIAVQLERLQQLMQTDLAQLNQQIREAEMPAIAPRPRDEAAPKLAAEGARDRSA